MYRLAQAGSRNFCISSPAKTGVYPVDDERVCPIDSGDDRDARHKVCQILEREEWPLHAIINTHSNADYIGGNKYLMQRTECRICASSVETAFTRHPILEPAFSYGGYPFKDPRHKFLVAQESDVSDVPRLSEDQLLKDLELIPLPSHFFQMADIHTPDDTVFLADCLSSRATLEKYRASFIYNVATYLETLDRVASMKTNLFVPAHAEASYSVVALTPYNRDCAVEVKELPPELRRVPRTFETPPKEAFSRYGLVMIFQQHVLVGSTICSYLSWLKDTGEMGTHIEGNYPCWRS